MSRASPLAASSPTKSDRQPTHSFAAFRVLYSQGQVRHHAWPSENSESKFSARLRVRNLELTVSRASGETVQPRTLTVVPTLSWRNSSWSCEPSRPPSARDSEGRGLEPATARGFSSRPPGECPHPSTPRINTARPSSVPFPISDVLLGVQCHSLTHDRTVAPPRRALARRPCGVDGFGGETPR